MKSSACEYFILKQYCTGTVYGSNDIGYNLWGRCIDSYQIKLIHTSFNGLGGGATVLGAASLNSDFTTTASSPTQNLNSVNSLAVAAIVLSILAICGLLIVCVAAAYFISNGGAYKTTSLSGETSGRDTMSKRENPKFSEDNL